MKQPPRRSPSLQKALMLQPVTVENAPPPLPHCTSGSTAAALRPTRVWECGPPVCKLSPRCAHHKLSLITTSVIHVFQFRYF